MEQAVSISERIPILSKRTHKLLARKSKEGMWLWDKINKEWELWTWEELGVVVEAGKQKHASN